MRFIRVKVPVALVNPDATFVPDIELVVDTGASIGVPIAVAETNAEHIDLIVDALNAP